MVREDIEKIVRDLYENELELENFVLGTHEIKKLNVELAVPFDEIIYIRGSCYVGEHVYDVAGELDISKNEFHVKEIRRIGRRW